MRPRAIFLEAARRLRLAPSEIWFVGDSWAADVRGSEASGMRPVWPSDADAPEPGVSYLRVDG